jgi:GDPmannose 4,6-dehydratase
MRVLIIGHSGQDGTLLRESLETRGDEVFGVSRSATYPFNFLGCSSPWDIGDSDFVRKLILAVRPDEIYYLAAHHTSSEGTLQVSGVDEYISCHKTHVLGLLNVLDVLSLHLTTCKIFYAASSLVFDGEIDEVQNELTPFNPGGYYGITKALGIWLCRDYRKKRGLIASVGILYNHESHYRSEHFLSQKIIRAAARIAAGSKEKLRLGDITARVDWGYAGDYVNAFQKILALPVGDDFIVATGKSHTVQNFAELSFAGFGLDWQNHVEHYPSVLTRHQTTRIGNAIKLRTATGWRMELDFSGLIEKLIFEERARQVLTSSPLI